MKVFGGLQIKKILRVERLFILSFNTTNHLTIDGKYEHINIGFEDILPERVDIKQMKWEGYEPFLKVKYNSVQHIFA